MRAGVRLRRTRRPAGRSWTGPATPPTRPAPTHTIRLHTDMALGVEGGRVRARRTAPAGRRRRTARCRGPTSSPRPPTSTSRAADRRPRWCSGGTWLDQARIPDHRWRDADPTLGAGDQGPHLHADRRDGRRAHDVAARDARRRAELGLPLHLDARLDVHPAGAALAQPRLGGRRVHAVRRRPRSQRRRRAADHVRHRRPSRPDRVDARPSERVRRRPPGARRQRRLRPAPERRLRRRARLDPPAHAAQPAPPAPAVADRGGAGRVRHRRVGRARTRASGRRGASPSTTCRRS